MGESVVGAPVGVAAELSEVRQPGVGALDGPSQPEGGGGLVLGGTGWSLAGADDVIDAGGGGAGRDRAAVITAVEVQGLDGGEQAAVGGGEAGSKRVWSQRFAPSAAQPTGMPARSHSRYHFQPDSPRSVGFLPVPGPPLGALCAEPSTATSARSRPTMRSLGSDGLVRQFVEHAGFDPFVAARPQRRVRHHRPTVLGGHPGAPGHQPMSVPSKHTRSGTRRRCAPNGWASIRCGNSASIAAQIALPPVGRSGG